MSWEPVSDQEAVEHPYYGVRGWLKCFYILALLSIIRSIYELIYPDPLLLEAFGGSAGMLKAAGVIWIVLQLPFLVLTPIAHPWMPTATIASTWINTSFTLTLLFNLDENATFWNLDQTSADMMSTVTTTGIVVSIVGSALWTWYLLSSKRVNVTFRNRVRDWETVLRSRPTAARPAVR